MSLENNNIKKNDKNEFFDALMKKHSLCPICQKDASIIEERKLNIRECKDYNDLINVTLDFNTLSILDENTRLFLLDAYLLFKASHFRNCFFEHPHHTWYVSDQHILNTLLDIYNVYFDEEYFVQRLVYSEGLINNIIFDFNNDNEAYFENFFMYIFINAEKYDLIFTPKS